MRHDNVLLCGIGALAFYLIYRFHRSGEMDPPPDFTSNPAWFDIKLLTNGHSRGNTEPIANGTYGDMIREILKELGIASKHYVHIGRVLGPIQLELQEVSAEEIRVLGNWDPTTQEARYSSKMPMKAIRHMAGFPESLHWNPRSVVEPPARLVKMCMPFLDDAIAKVDEAVERDKKERFTARYTLRLWKDLCRIALQDAAVIFISHPERTSCPLFQLPVFQDREFLDFVGQMRTELGRMVNPQDQSIESVLPGVLSGINQLRATIESRSEALTERVSDIVFKIKQLIVEANVETKEGLKEDLAIQLGRMATKLSGGKFRLKSRGGSGSVPKEMAEEEDDDGNDDVDGRNDAESDKDTVVPQQGRKRRRISKAQEELDRFRNDPDFARAKDYKLKNRRPECIRDCYLEFNGLGDEYKDVPVAGGLLGADERYRSKWRSHWEAADQMFYSRMKAIVQVVNQDQNKEAKLNELEELFSGGETKQQRLSVKGLFDALQEQGAIPKKRNS